MRTIEKPVEERFPADSEAQNTTAEPLAVNVRRFKRSRIGRRIFAVGVVAVVVVGMLGWFGLKTGKVHASSAGTAIELTYGRVSRRGLTTPWELDIRRTAGFAGDVRVETSSTYIEALTITRIDPQPTSTESDGNNITLTFQRPPGMDLRVMLQAQMDSGERPGRLRGTTTISMNGAQLAKLAYTTVVMP